MNNTTALQPSFEESLNHLTVARAGQEDSIEAALMAHANVMAMIFQHVTRTALRGEPLSPALERSFNLALRAGAQSGRILQQLARRKKAPAPKTQPPPFDPFAPLSPEAEARFAKVRESLEAGKMPDFAEIFGPSVTPTLAPAQPAGVSKGMDEPVSSPASPVPPPGDTLSTRPATRGFC